MKDLPLRSMLIACAILVLLLAGLMGCAKSSMEEDSGGFPDETGAASTTTEVAGMSTDMTTDMGTDMGSDMGTDMGGLPEPADSGGFPRETDFGGKG